MMGQAAQANASDEELSGRVAANLTEVRDRIAEAALRSGRDPGDVQLVAVTKTFPVEAILAAWEAGQRHFGENRPEEGAGKIPLITRRLTARELDEAELAAGAPVRTMPVWHMIGHVQSRKTAMVVDYFDVVHSLDRLKFARRLSALAVEAGREIPVLVECNVSGEVSKYGYDAAGWEKEPDVRDALFSALADVVGLPGLRIEGLMTVAPIAGDAEAVRPIFASLRRLGDALAERFPEVDWHHLSMGMTDDFEIAVEEGATLVRIGRAIFGSR